MKKIVFATCLVALLATAPATAQVDFTNYVALGDSYTAGFASGSLMDWYQDRSFPAVLASQAGSPVFEQAYVAEPGIGPIFELKALAPTPVIGPVGLFPGLPTNAEYPYPYNNLGIVGANLYDMIFQTGDIGNIIQGDFSNVFFDIVLRDGIHTALENAIGLQPTFMTVWIGNYDALTAVMAATAIDGVTMTPVPIFQDLFTNAIGALAANTTADIVLMNLPYSTDVPFATSVDPFVDIPQLGRWYLVSDTGQLTDDDRVTLAGGALIAQGYGLPGGPPLPDNLNIFTGEPGYVLRPAEVEMINDQIDAYNAIIADVGAAFGYPVMDVNGIFADIAAGQNLPTYGGVSLNSQFLLGGLFSYDGIHLQNIGYAVVADELIQFINEEFGDTIPRVDMAEVLFEGDWQSPGISPAKAGQVILSTKAFQELYKLAPPNLEKSPMFRRTDDNRTTTPDRRDPRVKPRVIP